MHTYFNKNSHVKAIFIILLFFLHTNVVYSQSPSANEKTSEATQAVEKKDRLGRESPRATFKAALDAYAKNDYDLAVNFFNVEEIPKPIREQKSKQLITHFFNVLNEYGHITLTKLLSTEETGNANDGLAANVEKIGEVSWNDKIFPVLLERLKDQEQGLDVWLISSSTLKNVSKIPQKDESEEKIIEKITPDILITNKWRGAPIAHWLGTALLLIISYLTAWIIITLCKGLIKKLWKNYTPKKHKKFLNSIFTPVSLIITVFTFIVVSGSSGFSIIARDSFGVVIVTLLWTALFLFLWLLIDTVSARSELRLRRNNNHGGLSVVLFFRRSIKFILITIAGILILDTMGVNVSAGLAALGIGGIAIALGAQKTVENLVGSISVVLDQPVRVGDFCKIGETMGFIESIGMRSTRIRTTDRTILTIPNGDFSSQRIDNYSQRDKFLFNTTLGLRYETSSNQMHYILQDLRALLNQHPKVDKEANPIQPRVRFVSYGADALNVEITAYILENIYDHFLAVKEEINFKIAAIIEASGTGFAFPSQTIYLARDSGLSSETARKRSVKMS